MRPPGNAGEGASTDLLEGPRGGFGVTAERLQFRTFVTLRTARLAVVEGNHVAVVCASEERRKELMAEYHKLFPHGPAPDFIVPYR